MTTDRGLSGMLNPDKSYVSVCVYVAAGWRAASTVCSGPCIPESNGFIRRSLSCASLHSTNQFLYTCTHIHIL